MTNPLTVNYRQSNVHPADRLLELREQIKGLQAKADAERNYLIENQDDLIGDEVEAVVATSTRKMLNREKLEAAFGDLSEYMDEVSSVAVRVKSRKG